MLDIQISQSLIELVKSFEGFEARAYQDIGGVWTIGFGTTDGVHAGMTVSEAEAESLLLRDLTATAEEISPLIHVLLTENEFMALLSFAYNVGTSAFANSTLLKLLNQGAKAGAAAQFLLWDHVDGREVAGLLNRRKKEQILFLTLPQSIHS